MIPSIRYTLSFLSLLFAAISIAHPRLSAGEGPYPPEIMAWTEDIKSSQREAGRRMLADITVSVAAGEKNIRVPADDYRFAENTGGRYPTHIMLPRGMEDVTIDFQGSTLWFETHASGIVLPGARRTTIRNVFLDWDPLPFIQGTVVAVQAEAGTFDVKLDPGYERAVEPLMRETWRGRGIAFYRETRELKAGSHGCEVTFSWAARRPDGSYRLRFHGFYDVKLADSGIEVGDPYAMLRRMQRGVRMENTVDCTLEDVTLYAAPFVAFVHSAGGGPTFRRCNILRRPGTNRLMAGNADGINCDNMTKGPLIEECRMETLGDDFVNVHGHLARVLWQEENGDIIATRMNRRSTMTEPVTVEFLERATMRSLGKRQATWTGTNWTADPDHTLANLKHKWHSGDAAALAPGKTLQAVRLKLDKPIAITGDVIVLCEALSSPGAIIRNNDFKGSLARGLRLQSPHVLVENNRISLTMHAGITLVGHASYWGEGPYVHHAIIRGNTLSANSIGGSIGGQRAAFIIQEGGDYETTRLPNNIHIENNRFENVGGVALIARGVDDLTITDNVVDGYGLMAPYAPRRSQALPTGMGSAIVVDLIKGLTLQNNTIEAPGPHASGEPVLHIDAN